MCYAPDGEQLHVAGVAVGQLQRPGGAGLEGLMLVGGRHQVHQRAAMGILQLSLRHRPPPP